MKRNLQRCPKCGEFLKNSKLENKDVDVLSFSLLFGKISLKKSEDNLCNLCGCKIKKQV